MRLGLLLDIFHRFQVLASCTNAYELMTWCFFFEVGCIISIKYLDEPYGTVPILTLWLPSGRFIPAHELL